MKRYDVIVLGGGTSGTFAAICAAKSGAHTLLVEKNGMLGGTATVGRVNFPGLFFAWGKQIIGGPCWDAIRRCEARGGATVPTVQFKPAHHWEEQISLDIFTYCAVLEEMCIESGVELLYHAMPYAVTELADGIKVSLAAKGGAFTVKAAALIDTTGDADGVRLADLPIVGGDTVQPATLINDIDGYDPAAVDRETFNAFIDSEIAAGRLSAEDMQGGSLYNQLLKKRISMHVDGTGAENACGKTALEIRARQILSRIVNVLRTFPALKNLYVREVAVECGVRETVRIVGNKTVTADEYVSGVKYDDAVCYAFYPVDRHTPTGIFQIFHQKNVVPTVPLSALIPKGSRYILAAGRCISADRDALSGLRVQAVCMATGQAAGVTAALAAKKNCAVTNVSATQVKDVLKTLGCIIP